MSESESPDDGQDAEARKCVSNGILPTSEFQAGCHHGTHSSRPTDTINGNGFAVSSIRSLPFSSTGHTSLPDIPIVKPTLHRCATDDIIAAAPKVPITCHVLQAVPSIVVPIAKYKPDSEVSCTLFNSSHHSISHSTLELDDHHLAGKQFTCGPQMDGFLRLLQRCIGRINKGNADVKAACMALGIPSSANAALFQLNSLAGCDSISSLKLRQARFLSILLDLPLKKSSEDIRIQLEAEASKGLGERQRLQPQRLQVDPDVNDVHPTNKRSKKRCRERGPVAEFCSSESEGHGAERSASQTRPSPVQVSSLSHSRCNGRQVTSSSTQNVDEDCASANNLLCSDYAQEGMLSYQKADASTEVVNHLGDCAAMSPSNASFAISTASSQIIRISSGVEQPPPCDSQSEVMQFSRELKANGMMAIPDADGGIPVTPGKDITVAANEEQSSTVNRMPTDAEADTAIPTQSLAHHQLVGIKVWFLLSPGMEPILIGEPQLPAEWTVTHFFSSEVFGAMEEMDAMCGDTQRALFVFRVDMYGGRRPITEKAASTTLLGTTAGFVFSWQQFEEALWAPLNSDGSLAGYAELPV